MTSFAALESGTAVVDLWTHLRIQRQSIKLDSSDVVMMSTLTDCWAPEAQERNLGRHLLSTILSKSTCSVRILTKNASIANDFDLISKYRNRVIVGLSITAPVHNEYLVKVIEPNASCISERLEALYMARDMGLRTYGMICPVLPGIGTSQSDYESMLDSVLAANPEMIWTEPLNARGPGIVNCANALQRKGYGLHAHAFEMIRSSQFHQLYVEGLINTATNAALSRACLDKLRILVYSDGDGYNVNDAAVIWLKR
ncbi:radical SAM family protein [Fundidesulfovibrio butyratiphilus]